MFSINPPVQAWRLTRREKVALAAVMLVFLVFGAILERRTALRRVPMTDLGVFAAAAHAVRSGSDIYSATDWHGWHYVYPPALAILFFPFAYPGPALAAAPQPGIIRTAENTPWGYAVDGGGQFYGLHGDNLRFFLIVGIWYMLSVAMTLLSAHLFACELEGREWKSPPPADPTARHKWWALRCLPALICVTSLGTEFSRGQVDVVMLFAIATGLFLAGRGRGVMGGVFLSIPAVIKLLPPVLLLLPLWYRKWRVAYGIALGLALTFLLIPVARLGPRGTMQSYRNWVEVLVKPGLGAGRDASRARELTNINATDNQSLLAFIHNWTYHALALKDRPAQATQAARRTVYCVGGVMLLGFAVAVGFRRQRSRQELLIIAGILIGMVFVVCPTVHNCYFLLLMPLMAGLIDLRLRPQNGRLTRWMIPVVLGAFLTIDILARLPGIGPWLRDAGAPFVTLVALMLAGVLVLVRGHTELAVGRPGIQEMPELNAPA